jgi:uncharacterized protein (UPF0218 family)
MTVAYSLTPELRQRLKVPLGVLIRGSFVEATKRFEVLAEQEKPPLVISVGDTVSRNLGKSRVPPCLVIVDNKCMRRTVLEPCRSGGEKVINVRNPQATITAEAVAGIQEALKSTGKVRVVVDGEEDLLALIAIMYAPFGSFVVYGQPYEGIVVVRVSAEKKEEVAGVLRRMMVASKS